jgi:predicted Zn-dependent protease
MMIRKGGQYMKKHFLMLLCFCALLISCQTVPISGRQQLSLVSPQALNAMSFQSYNEFLSQHKVIKSTKEAQMVKKVGQRIQMAVTTYLGRQNLSHRLEGYAWEFNIVDDAIVNAWCMPGGKVVVYSGMLPVTKDETGLAVVMGHEIAHAVANHGNERMSQGLIIQMGGMALATALSQKPQATRDLFLSAYGLGSQVGLLLPYGRLQETEADQLGLVFMAIAGYDPRISLNFWQRLAEAKQAKAPPEFLSTHPSDITRINNIKQLIPEAMKYYPKQK